MAVHFAMSTTNVARVTIAVHLAAAAVEISHHSAVCAVPTAVPGVPSKLSILCCIAVTKTVNPCAKSAGLKA